MEKDALKTNIKEFTISNEFLIATINIHGAELISLRSKQTNQEFLWCADPSVWGKTAPILFPTIGLARDSYIKVGEKVLPMTKHGFARNNNFELVAQSNESVTFELKDNDATRSLYPYAFTFRVTYELVDRVLDTRFEVVNNSKEPMYFALGGHTGFSCEINGSKLADYSVEFECDSELICDGVDMKLGLLNNIKTSMGKGRVLPLTVRTFDNDALIFLDAKPKSLKLISRKHGSIVKVDYKDFANVAIWAAKGCDRFVCVEPWISHTDTITTKHTLEKKPGFVKLSENKTYNAAFQITVIE